MLSLTQKKGKKQNNRFKGRNSILQINEKCSLWQNNEEQDKCS